MPAGISRRRRIEARSAPRAAAIELVLEVPLFDFGKANVREAEQRYLEAANRLGQLGVNAASEAREAYGAYRATYAIARKYEGEVLPLHQTISAETELQYNAMQVDAFALLEAARAQAKAKVASIEAKRNFWLASTDLSVAMLGGGNLASEPDAVIAATSGGDRLQNRQGLNSMTLSRRNFLGGSAVALVSVAAIGGRGQAATIPEAPTTARPPCSRQFRRPRARTISRW